MRCPRPAGTYSYDARHAMMEAVTATSESLRTALENMKVVEQLRRTLRDIQDLKLPDSN